jgi:hypothetical protein
MEGEVYLFMFSSSCISLKVIIEKAIVLGKYNVFSCVELRNENKKFQGGLSSSFC